MGRKRTSRGITTGCSILLADGEGFEPPKVLFHTLSDFKSDAFNRSANHPYPCFATHHTPFFQKGKQNSIFLLINKPSMYTV